MPRVSSVAAVSIVAASALRSRASAANVIAPRSNRSPSWPATGATVAIAEAAPLTKPLSSVSGSLSARATTARSASAGGSASIARLRLSPRPARPPPSSRSRPWIAGRVRSSKVSSDSSSDTGRVACLRASSSPCASMLRERPGRSSTYLSPTLERWRISSRVSSGIGPEPSSIFSSSTATGSPSRRTGSIFVTSPTRAPPISTSLPSTSSAASGTAAWNW